MITVVELPHPPSLNRYYRNVNGRVLISKAGREYRKKVILILKITGVQSYDDKLLAMFVAWFPPDKKWRDIDNILKATLDSLQHGKLYKNDRQIKDLRVKQYAPVTNGRLLIRVGELEGDGTAVISAKSS